MKYCFYFYNLDDERTAQRLAKKLASIEGMSKVELDFPLRTLRLHCQMEDAYEIVKGIASEVCPKIELNQDTSEVQVNKASKVFFIAEFVCLIALLVPLLIGIMTKNELLTKVISVPFYIVLSRRVLLCALKCILKGNILNEYFLVSVATIGAIVIGRNIEAIVAMVFFEIGELLSMSAVQKSKKSIRALIKLRANEVTVLRDGVEYVVHPITVNVGETIIVHAKDRIALDGEIINGETELDTSALTGESLPQFVKAGDQVLSGSTNLSSTIEVKVTAPYSQSTVNRILDMVESASHKKAGTERFISKLAEVYTSIVIILAGIVCLYSVFASKQDWQTVVDKMIVFLVVCCPYALMFSIPLGYFLGIGKASRNGVLLKGSQYLDALSSLSAVIFDKTGTLTKGVFEVTKVLPLNIDADGLVKLSAFIERQSAHPIAKAIARCAQERGISFEDMELSEYQEYAGKGIRARVNGEYILCGNKRFLGDFSLMYPDIKEDGSAVYVYNESKSQFLGMIIAGDTVRDDSLEAIDALKEMQIKTIMLSGDNKPSVTKVARILGITEYFAELYPEGKVEVLEGLYQQLSFNNYIAFVGDGINDSPVLARANVGIAMGGLGSEVAIEASDVVIMNDELKKIPFIIRLAKLTRRIVKQNMFLALMIKTAIIFLAVMGRVNIWEAIAFDAVVSMIAMLNSIRILKKKF